jgi:hypothetical protein
LISRFDKFEDEVAALVRKAAEEGYSLLACLMKAEDEDNTILIPFGSGLKDMDEENAVPELFVDIGMKLMAAQVTEPYREDDARRIMQKKHEPRHS